MLPWIRPTPVGYALANIFVGYHKSLMISALDMLPIVRVYFRYVDDCFAILETKSLALDFMCLLNGMHPSLVFTMEKENDRRLPFPDVMVIRFDFFSNHNINYRKPSFTGLYTQWQSFFCEAAENSIDVFSRNKSEEDLLSFTVIGGIRLIA